MSGKQESIISENIKFTGFIQRTLKSQETIYIEKASFTKQLNLIFHAGQIPLILQDQYMES